MSLLGSISQGIETAAGTFTHSFEAAAGIMDRRVKVLNVALFDAENIPATEIPTLPVAQRTPEQAPTFPLNEVKVVPTPAQHEGLTSVTFNDETFTTAMPTDVQPNTDLNADEIRAKLETIRYAQLDTQALAEIAKRSQN